MSFTYAVSVNNIQIAGSPFTDRAEALRAHHAEKLARGSPETTHTTGGTRADPRNETARYRDGTVVAFIECENLGLEVYVVKFKDGSEEAPVVTSSRERALEVLAEATRAHVGAVETLQREGLTENTVRRPDGTVSKVIEMHGPMPAYVGVVETRDEQVRVEHRMGKRAMFGGRTEICMARTPQAIGGRGLPRLGETTPVPSATAPTSYLDVELVMSQTDATEADALNSLAESGGDVVAAIMKLTP